MLCIFEKYNIFEIKKIKTEISVWYKRVVVSSEYLRNYLVDTTYMHISNFYILNNVMEKISNQLENNLCSSE